MKRVLVIVLIATAIILAGEYVLRPRQNGRTSELAVSGMVEATTVDVGTEIAGTVARLLVEEGDAVTPGQPIARLDQATWDARLLQAEGRAKQAAEGAAQAETTADVESATVGPTIAQAEAARGAAAAVLAKERAGARPQEIAGAEQQACAAEAALRAAEETVKKLRAGPRPAEIEQARAAVAAADAAVTAAEARLEKAERGFRTQEVAQARTRVDQAQARADQARRDWERLAKLHKDGAVADQTAEAGRTQYDTASADLEAAQQQLALLREGARTEDITAARADLTRAKAERQRAAAALRLLEEGYRVEDVRQAEEQARMLKAAHQAALAHLSLVREGAREEDIRAAAAELARAEAAVATARAQGRRVEALRRQADGARAGQAAAEASATEANVAVGKTVIYAPCNGIVQDKIAEEGETISPGAPIVRLINLDDVWLTVYVPETEIGRVKLGQKVRVTTDSFPGREFAAAVANISSEAEFTPKYVQTPDERSRLVYAVRVRLDNSERVFKPGMAADAVIELEAAVASGSAGLQETAP